MTHYTPVGRHGIFVPKHKDLHGTFSFGLRLEGRFRLITHSKRYGSLVRADFRNLILNQGLDRIGQGAWIGSCQVGTGSTAPSTGQTGLASYLAGSSVEPVADVDAYVPGPPPVRTLVRTRRFAEGVATGNLSEVGMGWSDSGTNLFSRALILDGDGNPTVLPKLADETLDVEYTLYVYPPTADVTGTISLGGSDYDYTLRTANVGTLDWRASTLVGGAVVSSSSGGAAQIYPSTSVLGDITTVPSGAGTNATSFSGKTYVPGAHSRGATATFGLSANPSGGVGAARFYMGATFGGAQCKIGFSPVVPKDSTKILVLEPRISWARH